ncbi:7TM diverse intracellular signaling domain-containing protein [Leptospira sp. B5-022]|uniref:7TM diverse intracellular signaling domain-containing protein n=2 Tax=unclassified Leptospira TaxID=2633828 RepID=UPI0002BE38C9|nr:7TM diverse intracellular signaling domain-containing protein [Leptospira sp. B5-022]EMJ98980.1 7TM diverse intracellular signaling [Leptospira sp. B5-022]
MNCKSFILYIVFTALLVGSSLSADDKIRVSKDIERLPLGKGVYYLEDPERKLTFEDITKPDVGSKFIKSDKDSLDFGQLNYNYWFRLSFENDTPESVSKLIEINYSNIDIVQFYKPNLDGTYSKEESGMLFPFSARSFKNRNFVYQIDLQPGQQKTYYLMTWTSGGLNIPLTLWDKETFSQYNADVQHGLGLYYGVMIVMILYNIFIFFSVRDVSYFYYVCYILGFLGIQMVLTGHGFQYLWPTFPFLQRNFYVVFTGICMASVLLFTKRFLNTKENVPKWLDKSMKALIVAHGLIVLTPLVLPPEITVKLALVLTLPVLIFIPTATVISFLKKFRPARYFLLAFTVLTISGTVVVLRFINVLGSTFLTEYGLYLGSTMEVILLSIALADRINIMKKEKEEAQARTLEMQKILTESYARFVPKDFLANLGKDSILDVRLGDQIQKEMAVLFSDIRSFTTLSEQMTPAENFNFINSYLSRMSPIIQRHNGFIDKFIGDAIMALFQRNVIDAVSAGVEMQRYLKEYNEHRHRQGYIPIQIGVGIHSGSLMLGTIGAEERLEGTVISDTVNLASRIESLTKVYGSRIAVSESTIEEVKKDGKFHFRFLDRVKVKGKQRPVSVYEVFDGDEPQHQDLKLKTKESYEKGVKAFYSNSFEEAKQQFENVISIFPDDKATQLYLKRLYPVTHDRKLEEVEE